MLLLQIKMGMKEGGVGEKSDGGEGEPLHSAPIASPRQLRGNLHGNSHLGALVNMKEALACIELNRLGRKKRRKGEKDASHQSVCNLSSAFLLFSYSARSQGLSFPSLSRALFLCERFFSVDKVKIQEAQKK